MCLNYSSIYENLNEVLKFQSCMYFSVTFIDYEAGGLCDGLKLPKALLRYQFCEFLMVWEMTELVVSGNIASVFCLEGAQFESQRAQWLS